MNKKWKNIATKTLIAGAIISASVDLTPQSWAGEQVKDSKSKSKSMSEGGCGEGSCGKDKKKKKKKKGEMAAKSEGSCGSGSCVHHHEN